MQWDPVMRTLYFRLPNHQTGHKTMSMKYVIKHTIALILCYKFKRYLCEVGILHVIGAIHLVLRYSIRETANFELDHFYLCAPFCCYCQLL